MDFIFDKAASEWKKRRNNMNVGRKFLVSYRTIFLYINIADRKKKKKVHKTIRDEWGNAASGKP